VVLIETFCMRWFSHIDLFFYRVRVVVLFTFSTLQLVDAPYKDMFLLLLDGYLLVVFQIEEKSIKIVRHFTLKSKDDQKMIVNICFRYHWIFALTSNDEIGSYLLNQTHSSSLTCSLIHSFTHSYCLCSK
jgi:hypothetical protein